MRRPFALLVVSALALAACSGGGLRQLEKPSEGPDEFIISPKKPLSEPPDFTTLPPPTPGGRNLTDTDPVGDAARELGGRPSQTTTIPATDGALVQYVSRFGVPSGIRATLADEDEDFRRRRGRFTQIRLFPTDRYKDVYRRETLDPASELQRWRNAGARTPSAPPQE